MSIHRWTTYVTCTVTALCFGGAGWGAGAEKNRTADELVQAALRAEIKGSAERQMLLETVLKKSPGSAAARWHTGHVRVGGRWVHVDEFAERNADNRKLVGYRDFRERVFADDRLTPAEQHRKLAESCARQGLPQRQRAHLIRLLEEAPGDLAARRQLGHVNLGGFWLQSQELQAARERAERAVRAMATWRPRLEFLGKVLLKGGEGPPWKRELNRQKAIQQWDGIQDPEAIPAMEVVFSTTRTPVVRRPPPMRPSARRRPTERPLLKEVPIPPAYRYRPGPFMVIERLGQIRAPQAAVSLARHAVFYTSQDVRGAAVGKLKARPLEQYVPVLLAALRTPMQARAELYRTPDGRLLRRQMYYREGQQHAELAVLDTVFTFGSGDRRIALASAFRMANQQPVMPRREEAVAQNRLNTLVCEVLAAATGEQFESTPENWWKWWNDYNEVYTEGEKPTLRMDRRQEVVVEGYRPTPRPMGTLARGLGRLLQKECLAAGTPVWTDRGPVAIEQIQVGDTVLAQHADTGELAFKPVLRTTSRVPKKMVEIATENETIEASGGHRFWVTGNGWDRARVLQAGCRLFGLLESEEVRSVRVVDPKPTYNLIVADFHTYFVGKARILSHDNTIPAATGAVVPGLSGVGAER